MSEQGAADVRFRDALDELDSRRADLKGMFEAASGWRWLCEPSKRILSVAMADGVVLHQLVEAGGTSRDGVVGPSRLTVVAAQGGSDERPRREFRPVAYDRAGQRYILASTQSASSGPGPKPEGWAASSLYSLSPNDLAADDVAFVGVEVRPRPELDAE